MRASIGKQHECRWRGPELIDQAGRLVDACLRIGGKRIPTNAHRLSDVTVVADAGMVSEANKRAIEAAGVVVRPRCPHPRGALRGQGVAGHSATVTVARLIEPADARSRRNPSVSVRDRTTPSVSGAGPFRRFTAVHDRRSRAEGTRVIQQHQRQAEHSAATADAILAKVRWVETNVKKLVANNSK